MGSADSDIMRAFIIAALAAIFAGDAKPYTVGQVLAGATHGGVITSTTYHGGLKVAGFPHVATALVPAAVGYAAPVVYGKREAEPYTVGQVLAGHTAGGLITSTTYAGGLKVSGLPLAHYPVVYGKREAEPQFFQYHNLGALATTNPVHAVAATPLGLTHSSNVGLCTNFVGAAVPC